LIITDFNGGGAGFATFLAVLNDAKAKQADIMYSKESIPNLQEKIAGKAYSEIYVLEASETLIQQVKSQYGKSMLPYKKELDMFSSPIWYVQL
jgi:hypothetical protein